MTVGGSTSGKATTAEIGARQRDEVCASHHASGVHRINNRTVVRDASRRVSSTALQSSLEKCMRGDGNEWGEQAYQQRTI